MTALFVLYFVIFMCFVVLGIRQGENNKIPWGMLVAGIMAICSPAVAWCLLV